MHIILGHVTDNVAINNMITFVCLSVPETGLSTEPGVAAMPTSGARAKFRGVGM